jgi:hypothetical protein
MIWRIACAMLILTAVMVACTVQRVPTECLTASVTTVRVKNKAFGYTPETTIAARGNPC